MLRVCTFNVRKFSSTTSKDQESSTLSEITKSFEKLDPIPSVVCLNEVNIKAKPGILYSFAQNLGKIAGTNPYLVSFFGHVQGIYGNAVLLNPENTTIIRSHAHHLPGGSEIIINSGNSKITGEVMEKPITHRISRGLIEIEIQLFFENLRRNVTIACTHLDHISEKERITQVEYIAKNIFGAKHGAILLGDLNAMKRSDYSKEEWERLEDHHIANNWSPPSFGAISYLENYQLNKWVDCFEKSFLDKDQDLQTLESIAREEKFSAHVENPICRIDHILADKIFLSNFRVSNAFLVRYCEASDHFPVIVDFELI